jgi:hypothetical protein
MVEQWGWLDNLTFTPQKGLYWADRPHRVTLSGVYLLPFGQGRALLGNASGPINVLVSGWEVAGADMNFAKTTRLADRMRVQLRFEVFNVPNQTMYDERNYSTDVNSPNFWAIDRRSTNQSNFPRPDPAGHQAALVIKLLW